MSTQLTWLGHGTWLIDTGSSRILLDPFLDDSPTAPIKAADVECDYILVSHGHFDHVADLVAVAKRTGATVVSNFEICQWCEAQGVEKTEPMNTGGAIQLAFGTVKSTWAQHSSALPDGSNGGNPGGFLLTFADGKKVYFACDTALFSDMQLIGAGSLDLAVLPIGDRFTMGPEDAVAATKLLAPQRVAAAHYNTWPPIEQNVAAWAEQIRTETDAEPVVIEPGEAIEI
jgi:L-ascorbate metabolism protein UlaG (beta-lactamase superfamily)